MGTRGAIGFRINNEDKVTYNHFDSYPSYLGAEILGFIQKTDLKKLKENVSKLTLVDSQDVPTSKQIDECLPWLESENIHKSPDWYSLLNELQGGLNAYLQGLPYMIDSSGFLLDSLFCEYAYIINLDEQVLEFYCGFNKKASNRKGRYAHIKEDDNKYYGIALIKKYPLSDIVNSQFNLEETIAEMESKVRAFRKKQESELNKESISA